MNLLEQIQLQVDETTGPVFWTIDQLYDAANSDGYFPDKAKPAWPVWG